ncbi:MAG: hypothetical protein FJY81_01185 [Candidatus Aminicenantes bacterium]|nr:hypothetical protein [Candidatus Aminicenantes bacterium]
MKHLRSLFWDADWTAIDPKKHKKYIIERVLELGDQNAVKWLFSTYSNAEIERVLKTSRNISVKSANYWSIILEARLKKHHV